MSTWLVAVALVGAFTGGALVALLVRRGTGPEPTGAGDLDLARLHLAARVQESILRPLLTARLALDVDRPGEAAPAVTRAFDATTSLVRQLDPEAVLDTDTSG